MRTLLASACLLTVLLCTMEASAQEFLSHEDEGYRRHSTQDPTPNQLILERAVFRARQRTARLEARHWLKESRQRPTMQLGTDMNQWIWGPYSYPYAPSFTYSPSWGAYWR